MTSQCHCTALRQAAAYSTEFYDAALAPLGIKVTMFRLLRRIAVAEVVSISDLAAQVGLDRSTLGRNLRVLERQAWIKTVAGPDRRERRITLTDTGRDTLNAALPLWQAAQDAFAQQIGPDALAALETLAGLRHLQQCKGGHAP